MSAARTERLLNLLTLLLNSRRAISLRELREMEEFAAYCAVDPKTGERAFERDKAALIELGVPLRWIAPEQDGEHESEGVGGYIVDRDRYFLDAVDLQPSELALLSIAGASAVATPHFPGRAAVIRALAKIGFDVDSAEATASIAHTPVAPGHDAAHIGAALEELHEAVARHRLVEITYVGASGEPTARKVEPYGLYYRQGVWYLVGHCRLRGDERTFHLGRVKRVKQCNPRGRVAEFEVPANFDLSAMVQRRPWEFPNEPPVEVRIRLASRLVPAISELFGAHVSTESCDDTQSGAAWVTLQVSHRAGLIQAVLPLGGAAEVVSPPDLRAEIGACYEALSRRYQGDTGEFAGTAERGS